MHFLNHAYMCAEAVAGHVHVSAGACGGQKKAWDSLELESRLLLLGTNVREVGTYGPLLGANSHNDNNSNNNLGSLCFSFSHPKTPWCHPFPGNYNCHQRFSSTQLLPC